MSAFWFSLVGVLLVAIALLGRFLDRLPVSPAMIYLVVGFALGPAVFDTLELHPLRELVLLGTISEIAVLIALFTVGVKMRVPIGDARWSLPLRLATVAMVVSVAGVAVAAAWLLGLPWGLAIVLGAALAPTDPVLASDVQLRSPEDRDSLRFALTGEGGLNDGTAFPFLFLGLGLIGFHELGAWGMRWLAVDVIWGTVGGLGIGFLVGDGLARGVRALRAWRSDALVFDEFLLLGAIALSYGAALAAGSLGFLAVFAAGLALRRADDLHSDPQQSERGVREKSPLTPSMLSVNEQLERIVEVAIVLLVGVMISTGYWSTRRPCDRGAAVLRDPPDRRVALAAEGVGHVRLSPADRLVRHPRHRLRVLRPVRRETRARIPGGGTATQLRFHGHRSVHRAARRVRDAAHGAVPDGAAGAVARR